MNRLTRHQIGQLFKRGRPIRTAHFGGRMDGQEAGVSAAVIVPKSVSNKATVRNKLRRKVKGALASIERKNGVSGKIAVVVKKPFTLSFIDLQQELGQCFKK